MKKVLSAVLCILLILSAMPAFARGVDVMVVANCNEYVSLRESPDTKSTQLKKVHLGEFVFQCSDWDGTFTRCTFDGKTGYILSKYLAPTSYSISDNLLKNQMVYNCDEYVSLRKDADTKSDRLIKVPKNAVVTTCIRVSDEWVMCSYKGKTGYVLSKYLKNADWNYIASLTPTPTVTPSTTVTPDTSIYPELPYYMTVTNVSEWATMRDRPSTSGAQVARVPLGEQVEDCVQVNDTFVCCTYNGQRGYIRIDLLTGLKGFDTLSSLPTYSNLLSCGSTLLAASTLSGYSILVQHMYTDSTEEMMAVCYDSQMNPAWSVLVTSNEIAELDQFSAFIAGTSSDPVLVIANAGNGLTAYRIGKTKQIAWANNNSEAVSCAGITTYVEEDGTFYIIGYYDSAPVCINPDGTIRWKAVSNEYLYWAFAMETNETGLVIYYDSCYDSVNKVYMAVYSKDGTLISVKTVSADSIMAGTLYSEE